MFPQNRWSCSKSPRDDLRRGEGNLKILRHAAVSKRIFLPLQNGGLGGSNSFPTWPATGFYDYDDDWDCLNYHTHPSGRPAGVSTSLTVQRCWFELNYIFKIYPSKFWSYFLLRYPKMIQIPLCGWNKVLVPRVDRFVPQLWWDIKPNYTVRRKSEMKRRKNKPTDNNIIRRCSSIS